MDVPRRVRLFCVTLISSVGEAKRRRSRHRTMSFDDDKVEATFLRQEGSVTRL